ncbi:hypothetical protein SELMODRAFT_428372 [Selaginella moellendorffii]|uniref:Uncharacterized protein n=1 Tax=Selaginella moellendorffii TaxID=88036 RepID=D8T2M1_SELML|nr:hypothetical protein SELMODRAFT_428372 [Selaginella moellendorffii]
MHPLIVARCLSWIVVASSIELELSFPKVVAKWTMVCQLVNWFTFCCMVRTLPSSIETVLTTIDRLALEIYEESHPWHWYFTATNSIWWLRQWFLVTWICSRTVCSSTKNSALLLAMLFAGHSLAFIEAGTKQIVKETFFVSNVPVALYTSQRGSKKRQTEEWKHYVSDTMPCTRRCTGI